MKGDKLVIETLLDSMIMNLEKGASVSLSEESDLLKFFLRKKPYVIFSTGTMLHHGVHLQKRRNQGGNPFA